MSNDDGYNKGKMQEGNEIIKVFIDLLSKYGLLLGTDIKPQNIKKFNIDIIISKLAEMKANDPSLFIITQEHIDKAMRSLESKKEPLEVKVIRSAEFKPIASEVEANYSIESKEIQRAEGNVTDFVKYFNSRLDRLKKVLSNHRQCTPIKSLELLKNFVNGREVCVVGIVTTKITTKKGNIMVVIEDSTADSKIIFMNGTSEKVKQLFNSASNIIQDEVIAIKGKYSDPFIIANDIIWPDIPIKEKKTIKDDLAIAFISDIHVGSKVFLENNFFHMLTWLNGKSDFDKEIAGKIKYMIVGGDVADGIGVYPNQEKDLAVLDEYEQYKRLFELLELIPDYIQIFVLPGNHDSVQDHSLFSLPFGRLHMLSQHLCL